MVVLRGKIPGSNQHRLILCWFLLFLEIKKSLIVATHAHSRQAKLTIFTIPNLSFKVSLKISAAPGFNLGIELMG